MDITDADRSELSSLLSHLCQKVSSVNTTGDLEREIDRNLQTIRDSFGRLLRYGKNDVFVRYLTENLEALAKTFDDASSKSVLNVTGHAFTSAELLVNAFGDGARLYRFNWKIEPGSRLFDDPVWRKHFALTTSMAMTGDMEMRAIIIVEDRAQCETPNVRKLLEFFASNRGLQAKIVLASDWETSKIDHAISPSCIEFGIHGEKLVYQADKYEPVSIGTWSRSSIEIKRFTSFFDAVWGDNKLATGVSFVAKESSSLSQLMAIDSTHERRHNGVHEAVARIEERINAA